MSVPIVVVGVGSISPLGHDAPGVAAAYAEPRGRLVVRDHGGEATAVAPLAPASEAALAAFIETRPRYRDLDRSVQLGLYAARRALESAGWGDEAPVGVAVGSSRGATGLLERYHGEFRDHPKARVSPASSPTTTLGNLSTWIAQEALAGPVGGPATELSSTCSTAVYAIGTAVAWLRGGLGDRFLAGGTEAPLTPFTIAQMKAVRVYTRDPHAPWPSRPCAEGAGKSNTMALGEGAGILALEAVRGGHRPLRAPLAQLAGVGFAVEATSSRTSLSDDGVALQRTMRSALLDGGIDRPDVIVTHTPGTARGDQGELNAIMALFGDRPPTLTSNKWLVGHTLGAAGALAVEYALWILQKNAVAPYPYAVRCPRVPLPGQVSSVLVNTVGFGGNAGSLLFTRP